MKEKNGRIQYIDVARGLAIILMVVGHMGTRYTKYLYAFHMPLFFAISGMTMKGIPGNRTIRNYIKSKIKSLFVPYFLWVLIFASFSYLSPIYALYASRNAISAIQSFGPLWFLPCLMAANILFFIGLKEANKLGGGYCKT